MTSPLQQELIRLHADGSDDAMKEAAKLHREAAKKTGGGGADNGGAKSKASRARKKG